MGYDGNEKNGKILIVDDVETNRAILHEILCDTYETAQAADGYEAISSMIHGELPDLVLLDIMMPEMDGFEVIAIMKNNPDTARIPIIFITASGRQEHEIKGLTLGAVDYITKPFIPELVRLRVDNCMELTRYRHDLEREVEKGVEALTQTRENMLELLVGVVEYRDTDLSDHVTRTGEMVGQIINELLKNPKFHDTLIALKYKEMIRAAVMHDIGKIAIPDSILLKPGRLTEEEFEQMKQHTTIGADIIERVVSDSNEIYYKHCRDACLYHHERWDGKGYPFGLKEEEIPLSARIVSVVDVYDALVSERPYKEPFDHDTAMRIVTEGSGTQFDPDIVDALVRIM